MTYVHPAKDMGMRVDVACLGDLLDLLEQEDPPAQR